MSQTSLRNIETLLGTHGGPFFLGNDFTIVDCVYAPFLERWRFQLPCIYKGLNPYDPCIRPNLCRWYEAMEARVPAYAARIQGDRCPHKMGRCL